MTPKFGQSASRQAWDLVERQHGVVTRGQLRMLGYGPEAIRHRLATGRLHRLWPGVYIAGRPRLTQHGHWMGAVLACGPEAVLSHRTAAALWGLVSIGGGPIDEVSVPKHVRRRPSGIVVHRRFNLAPDDLAVRHGIPVTSPVCTLIDLASALGGDELEAVVNAADRLDLADPDQLRAALDRAPPRAGVGILRRLLDRLTFTLTDSALERRFLPLARRAGLPPPLTRQVVNGYQVDFWWPALGLVVETDGLRYHRTPAQQARDRLRDQAHTTAGLTHLRFTHAQVAYQPDQVVATLSVVAARLRRDGEFRFAGHR